MKLFVIVCVTFALFFLTPGQATVQAEDPQDPTEEPDSTRKICEQASNLCIQPWVEAVKNASSPEEICQATKDFFVCYEGAPCSPEDYKYICDQIHNFTAQLSPNCSTELEPTEEAPEETDISDSQVIDLSADYLGEGKVLLTWKLSGHVKPSSVQGFKIQYKRIHRIHRNTNVTVKDVPAQVDDGGRYSAVLTLNRRRRYEITVLPYSQEQEGNTSEPTYIQVSAENLPVAVEVGVAASPLGPDTILISYKVEGDEKLENVELFYVQEGGTQWTQLYQDVIAFHGKNSVVLSNLEAGTSYFISAKAWFEKTYSYSVTYATTLTNGENKELTLTVGDYTLDWSHWNIQDVQGFKATVLYNVDKPSQRRTEVQYLPSEQTRLKFDKNGDNIDFVKIEPFDEFGLLTGAEISSGRKPAGHEL